MIVSFKSKLLSQLWQTGDTTLLPGMYAHQVADVLGDIDDAIEISDLELLGYLINEYKPENWSVTITVNNAEPIGSITCLFIKGDAHEVDFNQFD